MAAKTGTWQQARPGSLFVVAAVDVLGGTTFVHAGKPDATGDQATHLRTALSSLDALFRNKPLPETGKRPVPAAVRNGREVKPEPEAAEPQAEEASETPTEESAETATVER